MARVRLVHQMEVVAHQAIGTSLPTGFRTHPGQNSVFAGGSLLSPFLRL
jgi:hypothetical protein